MTEQEIRIVVNQLNAREQYGAFLISASDMGNILTELDSARARVDRQQMALKVAMNTASSAICKNRWNCMSIECAEAGGCLYRQTLIEVNEILEEPK